VSEQGRADQLDGDVEDDDEGVLEVLNLVLTVDLEGSLEEERLQGVHAHEDEGEHEVVHQAAEEVARDDALVEHDLTAAHLHFIIEL
jgi:hypothetical protein